MRTGPGEKHPVELRLADLLQDRSKFDRRRVRTLEEIVVVRQFLQLPCRGIDE